MFAGACEWFNDYCRHYHAILYWTSLDIHLINMLLNVLMFDISRFVGTCSRKVQKFSPYAEFNSNLIAQFVRKLEVFQHCSRLRNEFTEFQNGISRQSPSNGLCSP